MKFNLNYACLGLPGCSHPVGYLCGCSCHKSDKETEHDEVPMGISNWINQGKKYHYFDYIDNKMLIEFRKESRNYAKNGKTMQINPLKQTVYKRLEKMKLKDLDDKIEEIINKING